MLSKQISKSLAYFRFEFDTFKIDSENNLDGIRSDLISIERQLEYLFSIGKDRGTVACVINTEKN